MEAGQAAKVSHRTRGESYKLFREGEIFVKILWMPIEASRFGGETVVGLTRTVCLNESPQFFPACSFFGQNGLIGSEKLRKYSRGAPEPSPTLRDPFPTLFRVAFPTHSRVTFEALSSRFQTNFGLFWCLLPFHMTFCIFQ